ncbi:hypothetical protein M5W70_14105, partial [Paenibacillus larvae]
GLEQAQNADQHRDRPLAQYRCELIRAAAFFLEQPGQPVRLLIKLPVGQGVFSALDGYGVRRLLYLLFDELADRGIWREIAALAVKLQQDLGALLLRENAELPYVSSHLQERLSEQMGKVTDDSLDRRLRITVRVKMNRSPDARILSHEMEQHPVSNRVQIPLVMNIFQHHNRAVQGGICRLVFFPE